MSKRELSWKIEAFTAETMPLSKLTDYLSELANMLGDPPGVHLMRVESSSTVPVLKVDDEAYAAVIARVQEVRAGTAPVASLNSYRRINEMLRKDKAKAALAEGGAEIISFPGVEEPQGLVSGITQRGSIDGELLKVGGAKPWVPIHLRTLDGDTITGCFAKRQLAKQLATDLFEPIRLHGRGRWARTADGRWVLDKFWIETFEKLRDDDLLEVVHKLRSVRTEWVENPIADILRDETG